MKNLSLKSLLDVAWRRFELYCNKQDISLDSQDVFIKLQEELGELAEAYLIKQGKVAKRKSLDKMKSQRSLSRELVDVLGLLLVFAKLEEVNVEKHWLEKWDDGILKEK